MVRNACSHSKKLIGFIYRVFGDADFACLSKLYKSLVLPVLEYSSSVWDPHHKIHIQLLEHVQSLAARMVTKIWDWSIDSEAFKANLHWPSLASRWLVQKIITESLRVYLLYPLVPPYFYLLR